MNREYFSLFFVVLVSFFGYAQQSKVDSLYNQLSNSSLDTTRINILEDIARIEYYRDLKKYKSIADSMLTTSSIVRSKNHEAHSHVAIGRYYFTISSYKKAKVSYNKAIHIYEKINNQKDLSVAYGNKAGIYTNTGQIDSAKIYLHKALELNIEFNNAKQLFYNYYNLGIGESIQNNNLEVIKFAIKALEQSQILNDQRLIGHSNSLIGLAYLDLELYEQANQYFQKALKLFEQIEDLAASADQLVNLGVIQSQGFENYQKAIDYYSEALIYYNKVKNVHNGIVAHANIGRNYLNLNILDSAKVYLTKSYFQADSLDQQAEASRSLTNLAEIDYKSQNYISAKDFALKAVRLAEIHNYRDNYGEAKIILSNILAKQNNYKKAYENFVQGTSVLDSIRSVENAEAVATVNTVYQTEQKEKEILQLQQNETQQQLQIAKEKTIKILFASLAAIVLLVLAWYFWFARNKRNQLAQQNRFNLILATARERDDMALHLHGDIVKKMEKIEIELSSKGEKKLSKRVAEIGENIRTISKENQQTPFDESPFTDQIITLASGYHSQSLFINLVGLKGIDWTVINNAVKRNLHIIINEGLSNIYHHADASEVQITFQKNKRDISLTLEDNGKGLDSENLVQGIGIRNIKLKVNEINGKVHIKKNPKNGTSIFINIVLT